MVDVETVRALACALPWAEDRSTPNRLAFEVGGKGFAWTLVERAPGQKKGPRQPVIEVLAVRCLAEDKQNLLASDPEALYETDHYRGYPAVLVRLDRVEADTLKGLLEGGWRAQASKAMLKDLDAGRA